MSKHLYGLVITPEGVAANNRGETEGNITTLQKLLWKGEVYTTVSAEAIRFALRTCWQVKKGEKAVNRVWVDADGCHKWNDPDFEKWQDYIDDDVLGFMNAKAGKEDSDEGESGKEKKKSKVRGTCDKRRARLEVTRAISTTPFAGDITFNAASSGATPSASSTDKYPVLYGTEVHATRYQYGFALTPEDLEKKARAVDVIETIASLSNVAGNQARFLFDFSPDSIVYRWSDDFAPRILYGFNVETDSSLKLTEVVTKVMNGDIKAKELYIGGTIAETEDGKSLKEAGAFVVPGVMEATNKLLETLKKDIGI